MVAMADYRERLFPAIVEGSTADDIARRGAATGTAADPEANRALPSMDDLIRRGARRGAIPPFLARPPLTGAQAFGMSPAQVARYHGLPAPAPGGQHHPVPTPEPNFMNEALRAAGRLQRERRSPW